MWNIRFGITLVSITYQIWGSEFFTVGSNGSLRGLTLRLPWVGTLFLFVLPGGKVSLIKLWALWTTLITLLVSLMRWATLDSSCPEPFQQVISLGAGWKGTIWRSLEFGIDSLSTWMILLTTALFPICILCSWHLAPHMQRELCALRRIREGMRLLVWTSLDRLAFYVRYESTLIPMFRLIGLAGSRERKIRAAYQLVLYTLFGSLLLLPCLLWMYADTGTMNYELRVHHNWSVERQLILWWGFFFAFAVKIPMVPLHLWLPEAHVEASTAGSVLLAGVLRKLGSYGFRRFRLPLFPDACSYYSPFVLTISLRALIYASLTTLRQIDRKKIIAYSSVAHMNMVTLALFSLNSLGGIAAMFMMRSHGVVSPALFLLVGALYDRHHTKLLKYLGGAAAAMPLFCIFFFIFTLGNMAMPLSPNFIAEFLTLCGVFSFHSFATFLALIATVLSAFYSLWAYARVSGGMPKPQYVGAVCDLCRREFWTLVPRLLITIWWGLKPGAVLNTTSDAVLTMQLLMNL